MAQADFIDRLLSRIPALARAQGMPASQVAEFNRLFQLYEALDADELPDRPPGPRLVRDETTAAQNVPPAVATHLRRQVQLQQRYQQPRRAYLLLTSFYNAFLAQLEQDIAIAQASRNLGITAVTLVYANRVSEVRLSTFDIQDVSRRLEMARAAFAGIGRLLFPATFNPNDFFPQG
ncbi:MAG: hypothetical protein ACRYFX_17840 [Janthinobacterium lividum]